MDIDFAQAVETAQKALDLANSANQSELAEKIKQRLELYQANQPYYQPPPQNNSN